MMIMRVPSTGWLKWIHNPDKRKYNMGEKAFACTTNPLFFVTKQGEKVVTNEWFVNCNNELIYDIPKNKWVNMGMYTEGKSTVTDDIYYFEEGEIEQ